MMKILSVCFILGVFLISWLEATKDEGSERSLSRQKRKLLFPQFTTYQLSMCLVAQVSSLKSHRVAINTGFQINYDLPFRLRDFYSPIYWARALSNMSSPVTSFIERLVQTEEEESNDDEIVGVEDSESDEDDDELAFEDNTTTEDNADMTTTEMSTTEKIKRKRKPKAKRETSDLTAGQFYSGIRETISYSGYHEDCLLKSVCELAKHPLHEDDDNVINEVLHFILTPSLHQSFDAGTEIDEKLLFEEAEEMGKAGADCEMLYGYNCKASPLETMSRFAHMENEI